MAYSDIQEKVGQIQMANQILIAQSREDRDEARKKKKQRINQKKQVDAANKRNEEYLKEESKYYRGQDPNAKIYNRDGQEVLDDGSIVVDEDIRTDGPVIDPNTLLQIGGAVGGGLLRLLINPMNLQMSGLPYSPPVERLHIKDDKGNLIPSPLRFNTDAERIRFMEDFAKYDRPRT